MGLSECGLYRVWPLYKGENDIKDGTLYPASVTSWRVVIFLVSQPGRSSRMLKEMRLVLVVSQLRTCFGKVPQCVAYKVGTILEKNGLQRRI